MKNFLLVGHRATGKTTLARALRTHGFEYFDLDDVVRDRTDKDAASWVRESEPKFRMLEIELLRNLCEESEQPRVISVGAGCLSYPDNAIVVFIRRDGWERDALALRERLRPEMNFDEEVLWMKANREPVWKSRAHLFVDIPAGRAQHRTVSLLSTLMHWCLSAGESPWVNKTWLVAEDRTLNRAVTDASLFGLAGVELRDDLIRNPSEIRNCIASVRRPNSDWLEQHPEAQIYDVDLAFVSGQIQRLQHLTPRPLILSCHPNRVDPRDVEEMIKAGRMIESELPEWAPHIIFKYAPKVETLDQVGFARALVKPIAAANLPLTMLPQGPLGRFARPLLVSQNATNYIPTTLRRSRFGEPTEQDLFDFQDWLPNLVAPTPATFAALIGTEARNSQGDVWHRSKQVENSEPEGYVKIDVPRLQFDAALPTLRAFGIRKVSVTSPFKTELAFDPNAPDHLRHETEIAVTCTEPRMANTLIWNDGKWIGQEVDSIGMRGALSELVDLGIVGGEVAIIGQGGVHGAVRRGIEAAGENGDVDWKVVFSTGARDGWIDPPEKVDLVVNASGTVQFENAPKCSAWLDLHYAQTTSHPDPDVVYANGDAFFEAQAQAQREWWSQF